MWLLRLGFPHSRSALLFRDSARNPHRATAGLFLLPFQKKIEEANRAEERAKKGPGAKKKQDKDGRKVTFNKVITPPPLPTAAPLLQCLVIRFVKTPRCLSAP